MDLTAKGREATDMLFKGYLDRFEAALDDASKTDRDTLLTMLARIDGVLSEQKEGKG